MAQAGQQKFLLPKNVDQQNTYICPWGGYNKTFFFLLLFLIQGIIYYKISPIFPFKKICNDKKYWNLDKSRIFTVKSSLENWWLLLHCRLHTVYTLSKFCMEHLVNSVWKLSLNRIKIVWCSFWTLSPNCCLLCLEVGEDFHPLFSHCFFNMKIWEVTLQCFGCSWLFF